jgi:hypothetical protein
VVIRFIKLIGVLTGQRWTGDSVVGVSFKATEGKERAKAESQNVLIIVEKRKEGMA